MNDNSDVCVGDVDAEGLEGCGRGHVMEGRFLAYCEGNDLSGTYPLIVRSRRHFACKMQMRAIQAETTGSSVK